ncbi:MULTISPECIES: polysaccharide pyruvyl transferase family protein [Microbacterium]|uniref:polysaccharide pyruvyl transferase family protein n=1 Tax=Microbacterium TaxID=33882 RepID=UPI00300FC792
MAKNSVQHVFAQLSGQDDNLGDSVLRVAYLEALRGLGRHVHVFLGPASTDYRSAFTLSSDVTFYENRAQWMRAERAATRPVHAFNAGEFNPRPGDVFPNPRRAAECRRILASGGALVVAGIGVKSVDNAARVTFDSSFHNASVFSWRDQGSRDAAGFGEFAPDWAYALGTPVDGWAPATERTLLAITLRFDRPWPGEAWLAAVRAFAASTATRIVTLAQVARDAPRAVRLAEELGGEYLMPPSMRHDDLDAHARAVYQRALAVISDRAHGLIIAATEGAYPVGSGSNPEKIARLLVAVGLGALVGRYDELPEFAARFESHVAGLAPAIDGARADVARLTAEIRTAMDAVA